MENKSKLLIVLLLIAFVISGCGNSINSISTKNNTDEKTVVVDNLNIDNYFVKGISKQVFNKIPGRVVVVGENETETLIELGAAPNILLAAAQNSRKYAMKNKNAEIFNTLPKAKSSYLNMEYLSQLHPDLIIAQQCVFIRNRLNNTEYWNNHDINTMVPLNTNTPSKHFYQETIEKEMQFIADLGRIFHLEHNADKIISDTYNTIDEINAKNKNFTKPKVMIVEFLSSMISYDKTKLVGNMVESIGGKVSETPAVIGFENVVKENPDVLFVVCSHSDYGVCINKILNNKALRNLNCIKNKRVYSIPLRFTYGASCRTADGLKFLAERMYPGIQLAK